MRPGLAFSLIVGGILAALVVLRALDPEPVVRLQLVAFDTFQQILPRRHDPAAPVRIVMVDEESLARIGQWPWPRSVLAELTDRLKGLGAAVIGFDVVLAEPDRLSPREIARLLPASALDSSLKAALERLPSGDERFAEALAGAPVVLGFVGSDQAQSAGNPPERASIATAGDDPRLFAPGWPAAVRSLPILEAKARGVASLNWIPEVDQVVRRVPLVVNVGETLYPTLSTETLRTLLGGPTMIIKSSGASGELSFGEQTGISEIRIGEARVPTDARGQLWLHVAPSAPEGYIPVWKVLAGQVDRAEVEGRIVLVGASAAGLQDLHSTPLERSIPGVELHAQAIEQMLSGEFLLRPDWARGAEIFFLAAIGIAMALLVYWTGAAAGAVLGAVSLLAVAAFSWLAFSRLGWLVDPIYPSVSLTLLYIAGTVFQFLRSDAEKRRVRTAFSRYMSPALVEELAGSPEKLKLGGESREVTLLFADVRDFTTISERLDAQELTRLVNRLFTPLTDAILGERGTIDKYMGDAVMAFWNAPLDDAEHARHACAAALKLHAEVERLNGEWAKEAAAKGQVFSPIRLGVGLNTGIACVGNLGSEQRFDYSVIGDTVNIASRLEGLTKAYQVPVIVGEATARQAGEFALLEVDTVSVKGKSQETRIFALAGDAGLRQSPAFARLAEEHGALLAAMGRQDGPAVREQLRRCRDLAPAGLAGLYDFYGRRLEDGRSPAGRGLEVAAGAG